MTQRIGLGDVARDKITGFQGVVTCDVQFITGCRRLQLQPRELHEGKLLDPVSFDEPMLELVEQRVVVPIGGEHTHEPPPPRARAPATGGPRPEPRRQ